MVQNYILVLVLILIILVLSIRPSMTRNEWAYSAPSSQKNWWQRVGWERFGFPYYSYWESFENLKDQPERIIPKKENIVMDYPPDTPSPADLYNNQPYHLLSDEMSPPRVNETISCVNSRSCYATDFQRMVDKTGNFRQFTNNYKRNYPDSCSSPYQELVLNFYKADPMPIPTPNTGGSVSEL